MQWATEESSEHNLLSKGVDYDFIYECELTGGIIEKQLDNPVGRQPHGWHNIFDFTVS